MLLKRTTFPLLISVNWEQGDNHSINQGKSPKSQGENYVSKEILPPSFIIFKKPTANHEALFSTY